MKTLSRIFFSVALMATVAPTRGLAAVPSDEEVHVEEKHVEDVQVEEAHSSHQTHRHHLGVFIGGATRWEDDGHSETGMAFGLDYEYRFTPKWGVAALVEGVAFAENHRDLAIAVPLVWHPVDALGLAAGPGIEFDGSDGEFMFRFSVSYSLEVRKFTIAPILAVDLTSSATALVYGISIGRGF